MTVYVSAIARTRIGWPICRGRPPSVTCPQGEQAIPTPTSGASLTSWVGAVRATRRFDRGDTAIEEMALGTKGESVETIPCCAQVVAAETDTSVSLADAVRHLLALRDEAAWKEWIARCAILFPADEFLPFLVTESERLLNTDPHGKLRIAQALIVASRLAERPEFEALGRMATGDAFRVLGRYQESVDAMDEAGRLFLSIGDEVGWARTRIGWVWSSHNLGRGEAALAEIERAHEILVRNKNWFKAAGLSLHAGWVSYELGHYDQALRLYERARTMYESVGPSADRELAQAKMDTAILLTQLGDFTTALRLHEEMRQIALQHGETVSVLRQEQYVALVHAMQGHYTRALRLYDTVLDAFERSGLVNEAAIVALRMVECYLSLNRPSEALALANETAARFERLGTPTDSAKARFYAAIAMARLGETTEAKHLLGRVAAAFTATGLLTESALVILQQATLSLNDADWSTAYAEAEQASALFADRGLAIRQAQADLVRARASLALGNSDAAELYARSALQVSDRLDVVWLAHEAHHVLGKVAEVRADLPAALHAFDSAVESIERVQSTLAIELRTNFLDDKLAVYEDAIATSLRLSRPDLAFAYLERAKSRALVDYLASNLEIQINAREGTSPELLDALARLREEHNGLYNRLYGYGFTQGDDTNPLQNEETLRAAVREREKQIARLLERLALDRTEGLVVRGQAGESPPDLPDLEADTVLLEYFFGKEGGAVFVVTRDGITVVPLRVRPREVQRLLHQWNLNLTSTGQAIGAGAPLDALGRNARGILAMLYQALVTPVAAYLAGAARLIVIPYGATHAVPFHALFDGERYLIERLDVSVCPSSRLLRLCAERPRHIQQRALIVAHSDGGRLPAALAEARAIGALLPGTLLAEDAATCTAVVAEAPHHSVLHIAAHGEARLDNPAFAHLRLADGHLSVVDVFNLRLPGVLVTLSGCETGRSVVTGGDEVIGLSRGFLYAGASTLVQTLWRVEDDSTARLMSAFYREIRQGRSKSGALRAAQRAMLADKGVHPFYWAPFQLIGDAGPLSFGSPSAA